MKISRRHALKDFAYIASVGIFVPRAAAQVLNSPNRLGLLRRHTEVATASQTCTLWSSPVLQQQTTDNDFWTTAPLAQFLKITASGTVCKVRAKLSRPAADETVNIGFWSDSLGAVTQTGTTSQNVVINVANGSEIFFDFTWTVNPVLTADIFMVMKVVGTPQGFRWRADTVAGGTGYQDDVTYTAYENSNQRATSDFCFEVWTMQ